MNEDYELTLFDRVETVKTTINKYNENNFYISFSGGKDSTVLSNLIDEALPGNKIPRVFINTGIEYKFIVEFVKSLAVNDDRFEIINPTKSVKNVLETYGYPFKSKEHSLKLSMFQKGSTAKSVIKYSNPNNNFSCPKKLQYQFTKEFKLKVSNQCCYQLKKNPVKKWSKENNKPVAILGLRMTEGGERGNHSGCVVFDSSNHLKVFKPLNPVSNEFIEWYIKRNNIKLCKLYYQPYDFKRTGCKGCPYAINLQEQLDKMEEYLPNEKKQCELIWKKVYDEYRRINYRLKKYKQQKLF